jgi:gliding motility-associated-like protein
MKYLKFILSVTLFFLALPYLLAQYAKFDVDTIIGCDSLLVKFTNQSDPARQTVNFILNFGDGDSINAEKFNLPISHLYKLKSDTSRAKLFTANLSMTYTAGVKFTKHADTTILVRPHPNAFFFVADTFAPSSLTYCFRSGRSMDDTIKYRYIWTLNSGIPITHYPGNDHNIHDTLLYQFSQEGSNTMKLKVDDYFGCTDSYVQDFRVVGKLKAPDIFTPNGDGKNDLFTVVTNGRTTFMLKIFTLNGQLIYQAESKTVSWDGKTTSGDMAWPGTYFYFIKSTKVLPGDIAQEDNGFLYLLREK